MKKKKYSNSIGNWSIAEEKLGEDLTIYYGYLKGSSNQPEWITIPHSFVDGIGGFATLLKQFHPHEKIIIPTIRNEDRPNKYQRFFYFMRALFKKPMSTPLQANLKKNINTAPEGMLSHSVQPFAWHVFSDNETKIIFENAKANKVSLNTFLLYTLTQTVLSYFSTSKVGWWIPVNMRHDDQTDFDAGNNWGVLFVEYESNATINEIHQIIKKQFLQSEHWGSYDMLKILGNLNINSICYLIKYFAKKGFSSTGMLSNLGDWSNSSQDPNTSWLVYPPVLTDRPIGAGTLIYANKLSITLNIHSRLCENADLTNSILDEWKKRLINFSNA